jgi:hypothetical protein
MMRTVMTGLGGMRVGAALVARHRKTFDQESVLWETVPVCAAS